MVSVTSEPVPAPAAITAFAQRWAEAVVGTSYVSVEGGGLTAYLLGFTHRLVEAALVVEFDPSVGCQLGVEMIEAHFTGTQTLSKTLALIIEELPGLLVAARPGMNTASRVAQLVGSMAAGYAGALCERGLDEHDAVYNAGLRAHRQAEQALAASEARFRAVFTEAGIGIGIADMENNITDVNPALQRMFGYTLEEFTQRNVKEMVHPEDAPSIWENHDELVRGERDHFRMEKRFCRSDGGEIWTDLTVSLVRDAAGEPAYQVALLDDVSERRRLQAALRARVAQLTATRAAQQLAFEQAREEFYRDLHDGVQQTIAAARIDLDGLAEAEGPEEREQAVEQLYTKLRLALEQVHSLKRGIDPPELRFGLKPAIDRVVAELRLVARCRVADADLGVLTLPVYYLVRESLMNVHKHAHADLVEIDVTTDGQTIDVAVRDDGVGGATDRVYGGIRGMRSRVEELGGELIISSPVGVGTTIKVSVPCVSW